MFLICGKLDSVNYVTSSHTTLHAPTSLTPTYPSYPPHTPLSPFPYSSLPHLTSLSPQSLQKRHTDGSVSIQEATINEKLHESEKLITNLSQTWEDKLKKTGNDKRKGG